MTLCFTPPIRGNVEVMRHPGAPVPRWFEPNSSRVRSEGAAKIGSQAASFPEPRNLQLEKDMFASCLAFRQIYIYIYIILYIYMCQHLQRGHLAGSPSPLLRDLQPGHPVQVSVQVYIYIYLLMFHSGEAKTSNLQTSYPRGERS